MATSLYFSFFHLHVSLSTIAITSSEFHTNPISPSVQKYLIKEVFANVADLGYIRNFRVVPDPYLWLSNDGNSCDAEQNAREGLEDRWTRDQKCKKWRETKEFFSPPLNKFEMPDRPIPAFGFCGHCLQVIIRMSKIMLTPGRLECNGDSWQVAGVPNELIIATSVYYYDIDNITVSRVEFGQNDDMDTINDPYDPHGFEQVHDVDLESDTNAAFTNKLGVSATCNGRCICFPNVYQNQVSGFKLKDPSRLGHHRILAFFLVDSHVRIPSTKIVPPQQQDWWTEGLFKIPLLDDPHLKVQTCLLDYVEWPMSLKRVKEERLKRMDGRSANNGRAFKCLANESTFCKY